MNIEAKTNNIGVATAASINTIGNADAATTVTARGGNSTLSIADGTASLRSGTGPAASGFTTTSATQTLSSDSATLATQLNNVGDAASRQNIAGATFVNRLEGDTLINGNTYVNGTLVYTSNSSATTTVTSGVSILDAATQATTGQMAIVNIGGSGANVNANGVITTGIVGQTTGSLVVTNGYGNAHGVVVTEQQTTLTGGAGIATYLTMNDGGNNLTANSMTGTNNFEAKYNNIGVTTVNSINTIGNAGTSTNVITGATNAVTATSTNTISAGTDNILNAAQKNKLTGGTGNTITATTGDNVITATIGSNAILANVNNSMTATTGSNSLTANAANQSNSLFATGTNGSNNLIANATSGVNNVEAKNNNMGVATVNSINTIGNTSTGTTVTARGGTGSLSIANNSTTLGVAGGGSFAATPSQASISVAGGGSMTSYGTVQSIPTTGPTGLNAGNDASQNALRGAQFINRLQGNTLVDGNYYINGTLVYTSNASATTSVSNGQSVIAADAPTAGQMSVVNRDVASPHAVVSNGAIAIVNTPTAESTASLTLTNGIGNTHGVVVTEQQVVLSGGTHSTTMTLNDDGVTFQNVQTGGPTRVTGVADGTQPYDAVNYRQLKALESRVANGIAMASALSGIPQVDSDKTFMLGAGLGHFNNETAVAIGGSVRFMKNGVFKAGVAFNETSRTTSHAGFGYSF